MEIYSDVQKQISLINQIEKFKTELPNINIDWETDVTKMDFTKLRSYGSLESAFAQEFLRIEMKDISYVPIMQEDTILTNQQYLELIQILLNGGKLIPPATNERYAIVDGKEQMTVPAKNNGGFDGAHRTNLARFFGLAQIPFCIFKTCGEYWFTPDKWIFEGPVIREELQGGYSQFGGLRVTSKETSEVFTFKGTEINLDRSNLDYIAIIGKPMVKHS